MKKTEGIVYLVEYLPNVCDTPCQAPALHKPGMGAHPWKYQHLGKVKDQKSCPWLSREFEASLAYVRPCLMKKITGPGKSFQWEKVLDGKPDVLSWIPVTHLAWSENQCSQVVYDLHKYTSPTPKIYEVKKKKAPW